MKLAKFDYSKVPEAEFARLAAWIDGEGCFLILSSGGPRRNAYYQARLVIGQADERLMTYLQGTFGGYYSKGSGGTNRQMFYWRLYASALDEVIHRCMPYFICKGEQAEVVLAFRATLTKGRTVLSDDVIKLRGELLKNLKDLKQKVWEVVPLGLQETTT